MDRYVARKKFRLGLLVGLSVVLLSACAEESGSPAGSTPQGSIADFELPPGPQVDPGIWDTPLGKTALVATQARVDALAFDPIPPDSTGDASSAFVEDSEVFGPLASIAWAIESAEFPHLILVETPSGATQEQLLAPAAETPGCQEADAPPGDPGATVTECRGGGFSVAELNTTSARAVEGDQVVSLTWLAPAKGVSQELADAYSEPMVELTLMTPADEASVGALVTLAEKMGF